MYVNYQFYLILFILDRDGSQGYSVVPQVLAASQVPLVRMRYIQSVSNDALQAPLLVGASTGAEDSLQVGRGRKWLQSGEHRRSAQAMHILRKFERRNRKQRLRFWREELEFFEPHWLLHWPVSVSTSSFFCSLAHFLANFQKFKIQLAIFFSILKVLISIHFHFFITSKKPNFYK